MKALKKIYIALIMLFLYAPMLVMVVFSFNASNSTSVMSGFSLNGMSKCSVTPRLLRLFVTHLF